MTATVVLIAALAVTADDPQPSQLLATFRKEFVAITPGTPPYPRSFQMGSADLSVAEKPVHRVTFDYHFEVARYEVPQNLWTAVMGSNPSRWKGPRNSVEMLSYEDANEFCRKVTKQLQDARLIREDQYVRLPTEAEWEYFARAGTSTRYSFGDSPDQLDTYAWYTGNAAGNDPAVGEKKPNPWGLYDIHGYLWEWCLDAGHSNYKGAPADGSAWQAGEAGTDAGGNKRIIRGGSWKDPAEQLASACRHGKLPTRNAQGEKELVEFSGAIDATIKDDAVGLRCVLAPRGH